LAVKVAKAVAVKVVMVVVQIPQLLLTGCLLLAVALEEATRLVKLAVRES
jgi:hypothetical protein